MAWNNSYETKKFTEEQVRLAAEYRAAGMTEQQILAMHEYDLDWFNSEHAFRRRTSFLQAFDLDCGLLSEADKAIILENLSVFTSDIGPKDAFSTYWWIDEISNSQLVSKIKQLSNSDLYLLNAFVYECLSQEEMTAHIGINQSGISKRLKKIKNFLSEEE